MAMTMNEIAAYLVLGMRNKVSEKRIMRIESSQIGVIKGAMRMQAIVRAHATQKAGCVIIHHNLSITGKKNFV